MLLSAVSLLVVAQSSSEIPERLMNNPVYAHASFRSLSAINFMDCSNFWNMLTPTFSRDSMSNLIWKTDAFICYYISICFIELFLWTVPHLISFMCQRDDKGIYIHWYKVPVFFPELKQLLRNLASRFEHWEDPEQFGLINSNRLMVIKWPGHPT